MKHVKNVWAFAVVLLIMTQLVSAQVRTVNGTVTDENSNPLAGISVQVKGGTAGTATNEEGVFHLEVPAGEIVLTFSSIGYRSEEVTVGGENQLTVVLESDAAALDEIVVIGYGTSKRRDLRSEEHTSELQSLMRTSYAVFCLKKKRMIKRDKHTS